MKQPDKNFYDNWAKNQSGDKERDRVLKWKSINLANIFLRSTKEDIENICEIGGAEGTVINSLGKILNTEKLDNYELSSEFCKIGKKKYPHITFINSVFSDSINKRYNLTILSDILEHVESDENLLSIVNKKSRFCLIKIPIEKCLMNTDTYSIFFKGAVRAKNIRYGKNHYNGHLRGYSIRGALNTIKKYFDILDYEYSNIIYFDKSDTAKKIGKILGKLPSIWIFGGALFILGKSKKIR